MWKKLVILGHSNEKNIDSNKLTFDGEVRTRAGGILFQQKKVENIFLLGGGNDKVMEESETAKMKKYLLEYFQIDSKFIFTKSIGTNTLENVSNFLSQNRNIVDTEIAYLTSDYNVARLKLILEIFGVSNSFVLSAEKILLFNDDKMLDKTKDYLNSIEYQNRLKYESYWLAKIIFDADYTTKERRQLAISIKPVEYFQNQPKRKMENLEEKK